MKFNPHVLERLSWRVPLIMLCFLAPTLAGMSDEVARPWREVCVAALVVAFGSWASRQGRRSPDRDNKPEESSE